MTQKLISILFSVSQYHTLISFVLILFSFALGFVISVSYMYSCKKEQISTSLALTLVALPSGIAIAVYLISTDLVYGITLAGLFMLVRFRTFLATSKDITYLLCALCVGFALGLGAGFSVIFEIFFCLVLCFFLFAFMFKNAKNQNNNKVYLTISIYQAPPCNAKVLFSDIFEKYLLSYEFIKSNTKNNHKILTYCLLPKTMLGVPFIQELRQKNSNLPVELSFAPPVLQVL